METARAQFGLWCGTWEPVAPTLSAVVWTVVVQRSREGGLQAAGTVRSRVPMRGTGTDRFVVAVMPGNAGGAKGPGHLGMFGGQP